MIELVDNCEYFLGEKSMVLLCFEASMVEGSKLSKRASSCTISGGVRRAHSRMTPEGRGYAFIIFLSAFLHQPKCLPLSCLGCYKYRKRNQIAWHDYK
jgi:hypothetical protein